VTVLSALASFALIAGLLTIVPGLDTALVLRAALGRSRRHAYATAVGIGTGALIWGVAAAAGVTALLTASRWGLTGLRLAGAGYLLWLGGSMLLRSLAGRRHPAAEPGSQPAPEPALDPGPADDGSVPAAFGRGLLTNLLNPKVGVFYLAMIPQFLPAGTSHLLMGLLLAGVHDVEGMLWFTLVITLAGAARRALAGGRLRRAIDRVTGVVLIGFGIELAASR